VLRDAHGSLVVETADGDPFIAASIGVLIGALIGALAGPVGSALSATRGAVLGAATGGAAGLGIDASNADTLEQAFDESGMLVRRGQHAVIADIDEQTYAPLDSLAGRLGAKLYRRPKSEIASDKWQGLDPFFVPYDYDPVIAKDKM